MIRKLTNKDENFYKYMGKYFGSRLVEKQINDRIYDDNNKEWYMYLEKEKVVAFVAISNNKIKNVYAVKNEYLEKLLNEIQKQENITSSVVTNQYTTIYERCGFSINKTNQYKNFITIYIEKKGR